ncbi:tape measure protein [Pseudomonas sp. 21LCFQ010]|uniref:tape measure protein n=1 Tax=Pseudomonas sp. 21LCFQ010 TaxID=2957506 RepID=UPI002097353A|nr:tape measure protein [Pseudomonas sp. 21LCFQ010]MCO8164802.1 tape measure protein [Pseudomonas sp. 21LCFQ010]
MTETARLIITVDSRQVSQAERSLDSLGRTSSVVSKAAGALTAAFGARELYQASESYATLTNRMRLVTESAVELRAAQDAVFKSAQNAGQPLNATGELYQRIAANQKALALTGKEVAGVTDTISKTLAISGTSATSASAALTQLGQAFASGTLRGEELNSVMEQAPALSQAIAAGMGKSVGELRALGAEGKLTADAVVKALQDQADEVDEKFGKIANTIGTALQVVGNTFTRMVGEIDQASGATSAFANNVIAASKFVDTFTANSESLSTTIATVGTVATIAAGRVVGGFSQQAAAALFAANANRVALNASAASAAQDVVAAQSKQIDAKAMLERATTELATAQSKVASDRVRQASELANIQMVRNALTAELALEQQRLKAQISETGRAQSVARMAEIRRSEIAIIKQVEIAERQLAATTVATSAQVQAAYTKITAAKAGMAETTLAANAAIAASDRATAAASAFTGTGRALLGLLGGPAGLVFTIGAVAASYLMFRDNSNVATAALIDQNLTIDDSIAKFTALGAAQRTLQLSTWAEKQAEALKDAGAALDEYKTRGIDAFGQLGVKGVESADRFKSMVEEVRSGTRSLDSVTQWVKQNNTIMPTFTASLEETAAAYEISGVNADKYRKLLAQSNGVVASAAVETDKLSAAQKELVKSSGAKADEWAKYVAKLKETRDLIGANAEAEAEYNAIKMGANAQQLDEARLLGEQTVVLKALQDAYKESNKTEQEALKVKLAGLYAAEDAAKKSAEVQAKAHADTAAAAESSAKRQAAAFMAVAAASYAPVMANPKPQNLSGYGLLTNGGTPTVAVAEAAESVADRVAKAWKLITEGTEVNKQVDKAANEAARALKAQQEALDGFLEKTAISISATNAMADAYLGGANNVRTLTIEQKIEEELLKTGAGARTKVTKAINDEADARDRLAIGEMVAQMRTENDQTLDLAKATLQGEAAIDAYNVAKQVQTALIGKNIAVGSQEYKQLLEVTKAQLDNNKALDQASKARNLVDRLNPEIAALKEYREAQKALTWAMENDRDNIDLYQQTLVKLGTEYEANQRAATAWGQITIAAVDRIDDAFADMWKSVLDGSGNFMDTLKNSFRQFLAEMLHMAITKPIVVQIAGALGVGGLASQTQSGGIVGSLFGDGGGGGFSVSSMISGAKTVIDVAGSKFVDSVVKGWAAGGDSFVNSVSGAIKGGGSYAANAISSAFATGSQTASTIIADGVAVSVGNTGAAMVDLTTNTVTNAAGEVVGSASSMTTNAAGSTLGTLSAVLSYIQGVYSIFQSFEAYGFKGAAVTGGMAAAGAALGTYVFPGIGTAIGFAVGAALGAIGADKWFGSGEKYEELASSASGTYKDGVFTDRGWVEGWKEGETKFGTAVDKQLTGYAQQFSTTLGMLYDTLGNGADVATDLTMRRRRTSGNYSSTFSTTLDNGQEFSVLAEYEGEIEGRLNEYYDDLMGIFLAQSIVGSGTLPAYFRAQFEKFAHDWDATAEDVIGTIEGIFTRFNGVNGALEQVNVSALAMGENGLIASDAILNMVAKIADLDVDTATAKEKVKVLTDLTTGYYNAFFSADEQFADLQKNLENSFASFALKVPDTRESYRAMVEDIDVSTAAGQAMFATFMGLATAADAYYSKIAERQQAYNQAFLSESENTALAMSAVREEFKKAGVDLPTTRDAFRSVVEGIDRSTEAGKKLYDSMMALAGSADMLYTAQETILNNAVTAAMGGVQRAVNAEKSAITAAYNARVASLNDMMSSAQSNISGLTSITNALDSALKALRGTSDDAVKMMREQAKATVNSALAIARAGGSLSGFEGLEDALGVISDNDTSLYSSLEAFNREQGRNANLVAELNGITGKQLTADEKLLQTVQDQIKAAKSQYEDEIARLDKELELAQSQVDALNGIDNSVISVRQAMDNLAAAIAAATAAKAATPTPGASYNGTGAGGAPSYSDINAIYQSVLGRDADVSGAAYWAGQLGSGSVADLAAAIKADAIKNGELAGYATGGLISGPGTGTSDSIIARLSNGEYVMSADAVRMFGTGLLDQMNAGRIPAFAAGGNVGETGPVLQITRPSQIYTAHPSQGRAAGQADAATVAELKALRDEIRAGLAAIATNTKDTSKNTGQLAEVGTQVIGTAQVKVIA